MTTPPNKALLKFMTEATDGTYEAPKPTDEQLAAVLPWIIDQTVTWALLNGHCDTVNSGLYNIATAGKRWDGDFKFYAANGCDCYGYNRDGYNKDGFNRNGYNKDGFNKWGYNRDGYNKDGFNERGYTKDGFNADGVDRYGQTREQVAAKLVGGWTKEYLDLVATKLAEREAARVAAAAATEVELAKAAEVETRVPVEEPTEATVPTEELVTAA